MKIGTLVRLKSGSPIMTVCSKIFSDSDDLINKVKATWFNSCYFEEGTFAVDTLKIEESK